MKRFLCLLTVLFANLAPAFGGTDSDSPVPTVMVIGTIHVHRSNVFTEKTGAHLPFIPYGLADKVHVVTREEFILNALTFKEGDPFDPAQLKESERILRREPIFRYVRVEALPPEDGRIDVMVETEDTWTTVPRLAYGVAGGVSFYTLGILEHNFLGQGKEVGAFIEQDIDRLTRGVSYLDRQLLGSRWTLYGGYGQDEKGRDWQGAIDRPFYSARVQTAAGASIFVSDDEDRLFQNGDAVVKFDHRVQDHRVYGAFETDPRPDQARRWTLAFERQEDKFGDVRFEVPPPTFEDRIVAALLAGFDYRDERYERFHGVLTFDRDEDVNLGWEWMAEAGPSLQSLGATRDGGFGRAQIQKIFLTRSGQLWFNHLDASGREESNSVRDGVMRVRSEFFWPEWLHDNTASLRGEWASSHNLDPESQFLLGGENGLRGYSVRQFSGDNSLLVTLENRRVVLYDWLQLMSFGWAVFADAGSVWRRHESLDTREIKSDVGAGIRFSPTRSTDPGLIRIDIAYALNNNDQNSRFVLNIGADLHFGARRVRKFEQ